MFGLSSHSGTRRVTRRLAGWLLVVAFAASALASSAAPAHGTAAGGAHGGKILSIVTFEGTLLSGQLAAVTCSPALGRPADPSFFVQWGDIDQGLPADAMIFGQQILVSSGHIYAEEGTYSGNVFGSYRCGRSVQNFTKPLAAQILDARLSAKGVPVSSKPGQLFQATVATFTDADPAGTVGDYNALIFWGDGSSSTGTIIAKAKGRFAVTGAHSYLGVGVYVISVQITDVGGGREALTTASVAASAPQARFDVPAAVTRAGHLALFDASGSHSPGSLVTGMRWSMSGPGVIGRLFTASCGGFTSDMMSSFSRPGVVRLTLRVRYASGAVSTVTHSVAIRAASVGRVAGRMDSRITQWLLCHRGPRDPKVQPTGAGGPPAGCQDEYFDGLIDAIGCFTVLSDYGKIPQAEYKMMCPFFATPCTSDHPVLPPPGLDGRGSSPAMPEHCGARCIRGIRPPAPPVMSTETVRVNGVDVTPDPGAALVLDQNDGLMASSAATVTLLDGELPLRDGPLLTATFNVNGDLPLLDANLDELASQNDILAKELDLGGFHLRGTLTVDLVFQKSLISANLALPSSFTDPSGGTLPSRLTATADNQHGLVLDDLSLQLPNADFAGALRFDNLNFCFQRNISLGFCQSQTGTDFGSFDTTNKSSWNATGDVSLLGTDVRAAPPPPLQGIGFVDGQFDFAGLTASFPDPGIPLGDSGLSLTSIGAGLGLDPTRFEGSIGLTAADLISINGEMFLVFASPDQPYTFTGTELGGLTLPTPTAQGFAVAVGGTVGLNLPAAGLTNLDSGYVLYAAPAYLAFGGGLHFSALGGDLVLDGGVSGQAALDSRAFDLEGRLHVHALFVNADANAVLSSTGIAACGTVHIDYLVGSADVSAGAGYRWGGGLDGWLGSCDLSSYRVTVSASVAATAAAAARSIRLNVPGRVPNEMIKLRGKEGAPDITITGPGGVHASTGGGATAAVKPFIIYRVARQKTTYIAIIKPRGGTYTITTSNGSPKITEILQAHGLTPTATGRVVRCGHRMCLSFTDRNHPGQRVIFAERDHGALKIIGSSTRARGIIRFTPTPGPGGRRQIIAQFIQNGAPVILHPGLRPSQSAAIAIAAYRAPGPRTLPRVRHLRVRHAGTRVLVTFAKVRGASGYLVTALLSSGEHMFLRTTRHTITIRHVFGEFTGIITIRAVGNNATTTNGPPARARFRRSPGG